MSARCPVCGGGMADGDIVCVVCRDRIARREGGAASQVAGDASQLEDELDRYVEREPSAAEEFLVEQAKRLPWWIISFLVHALAFFILWKWPYSLLGDEEYLTPIAVSLTDRSLDEVVEEPEPPDPDTPEDLELPIEDIPIFPHPPSLRDPGPDLDLPSDVDLFKDVERPVVTIDPPSATPVFAVQGMPTALSRGIYSGRTHAGRERAVGGRGGTSRRAESAVMAGLKWLARAQEKDGHWSCRRWEGGDDYDVGMTGLALLAFLGAGYTHEKGPFKETVGRGLRWLKGNQKGNGSFGWKTFYEQGIAAMAVSEAYGLTRSPEIGRMAQRAIDYIVAVQPHHGGFRYAGAVPRNEGDMSVTGWQVMALKSGVCCDLTVPYQAFEKFRTFLRNTYRDYGGSSYLVGRRDSAPAVTAIGMLSRQFVGGGYDDEIRAAANYLLSHEARAGGPARGKDRLVGDLYYTYYSVLAMFQIGGEYWARWNKLFRDTLVRAQVHATYDARRRYVRGSWEPRNHQWGRRGGRVYCTAMAILCLEVYYRFLPVYRM